MSFFFSIYQFQRIEQVYLNDFFKFFVLYVNELFLRILVIGYGDISRGKIGISWFFRIFSQGEYDVVVEVCDLVFYDMVLRV